ncbi:hypothetical protein [Streptomyces anthocyanicus]|uniref:hypothetical protein n=1 Tax=Streptomyces anthocyanicus TaxID=68174 RepID=UPI003868C28E|nr:hypothetical protein OH747_05510 [Streptomyces anthocyanicus]
MAWYNDASDADLQQSMELGAAAAKEAADSGDHKRAAALHEDLNGMIAEARRRGWKQGSGWKAGRR